MSEIINTVKELFKSKNVLEIGGPSFLFNTDLPIYKIAHNVDCVNYSSNTIWEGVIREGKNFEFRKNKTGFRYILEATSLYKIKTSTYDCLISSNCLEHIANPIRALKEWKRVLNFNGLLLLILPKKESNFDHRRPYTTFDHIVADYINNTDEDDLTHLDEILKLHDLNLDPPAGSIENFKSRSEDNFNNRTLHHHVFSIELIKQMLNFLSFEIINMSESENDLFSLAIKRL